jgi:hypothetical protein
LTPTINSTAGSPLRSIVARPAEATSARISISRSRTASPSGETLDHLGGGRRADVGEDQRLLEALPGLLVDLVEEAGRDLLDQRLAALREALAQAAEDAAAFLGHRRWLGHRGCARAKVEGIPPGGGHGPMRRQPSRH